MEKSHQSVPELLEQYVFSIADQLIDQLEKPQQDQLIQLLVKLDGLPADQRTRPANKPIDAGIQLRGVDRTPAFIEQPISPDLQPESFYEQNQPQYAIRRLVAFQQTHIDSTIMNIAQMGCLIERAQNMSNSVWKTSLLARYESLRDSYIKQLIRMQALQREPLQKLRQYQKQLA